MTSYHLWLKYKKSSQCHLSFPLTLNLFTAYLKVILKKKHLNFIHESNNFFNAKTNA